MVNGIFKYEYLLDLTFRPRNYAQQGNTSVRLYDDRGAMIQGHFVERRCNHVSTFFTPVRTQRLYTNFVQ